MKQLLVVFAVLCNSAVQAQSTPAVRTTLSRADSAYARGEFRRARELYGQVFAADSTSSRAVFRLAQLEDSEARALSLYRRYIALEPSDAWGHMAEGDQLARMGRWDEGLIAYDGAQAVAPGERDVSLGRARLLERAGRPHHAAEELAAWTTTHPDDGEAWDLLGRARMRSGRPLAARGAFERATSLRVRGAESRSLAARAAAAIVVSPEIASSGDSDGSRMIRIGAAVEAMPVDGLRLGTAARRFTIADDLDELSGFDLQASVSSASPGLRVDVNGGLANYGVGDQRDLDPWTAWYADARVRTRAPANGPSVDLRLGRGPLGLNPQLVLNHVSRSEARATVEIPVWRLRARANGRLAAVDAYGERTNHRTSLEAALLAPLGGGWLPSLSYRVSGYERASTAGYFAPRRAETVELGAYFEAVDGGPWSLSADVGAGAQRITQHASQGIPASQPTGQGNPTGPGNPTGHPTGPGSPTGQPTSPANPTGQSTSITWSPVWRAWMQAELALGLAGAWYAELEAYDAAWALEQSTTSVSWRSVSLRSGIRLQLR